VALPKDPDRSARAFKERIGHLSGKRIAVIISDTFGRPWRNGQVNMAIGVAGIDALADYRGLPDNCGKEMQVTQIAVADELCSAAELVSGKTKNLPVVIIRNYPFEEAKGAASDLVREEGQDILS
jgi:coenzyme F420-0:L-glutamate ligase/coenzyme F420-1:gamma-L-glutamate ligase